MSQIDHRSAGSAADVAEQFVSPGDRMRRQQHIVERTEPVRRSDRLGVKTIQGGPCDAAAGIANAAGDNRYLGAAVRRI